MISLNNVEILERAKSLIDTEDKWCKGKYYSNDGRRYCIVGALSTVLCQMLPVHYSNYCRLRDTEACKALLSSMQCHPGGLSYFNDLPSTTHSDVMKLFDEAIERLKK